MDIEKVVKFPILSSDEGCARLCNVSVARGCEDFDGIYFFYVIEKAGISSHVRGCTCVHDPVFVYAARAACGSIKGIVGAWLVVWL